MASVAAFIAEGGECGRAREAVAFTAVSSARRQGFSEKSRHVPRSHRAAGEGRGEADMTRQAFWERGGDSPRGDSCAAPPSAETRGPVARHLVTAAKHSQKVAA